eukprot:TRINITY_DN100464_c0_g1_i1.p1 TRINITY_DN100464_c0_g1~~TRINITY_DN100464_c0_g1_i1.p1  ORF type:complete len:593 (-),score=55.45 TRINITY_DN100464_c0_g1_i1:16-1794(-)
MPAAEPLLDATSQRTLDRQEGISEAPPAGVVEPVATNTVRDAAVASDDAADSCAELLERAAPAQVAPPQTGTNVPWGPDASVPVWAVYRCVEDRNPRMILTVAPPAVSVAWKAFGAAGCAWILTPLVTYFGASCSDGSVFATMPTWLFVALLAQLVPLVWFEFRVLRYTIVSHASLLAQNKPLTIAQVPLLFAVWFLLMMMLSCAAHADVVTSGVFLGKVLRSEGCEGAESKAGLTSIWQATMASSMMAKVLQAIPFSVFVVLGWLALFGQGVYALLYAWPVKAEEISADGTCRAISYEEPRAHSSHGLWWPSVSQQVATLMDDQNSLSDTLNTLADACRMTSFTSRSLDALQAEGDLVKGPLGRDFEVQAASIYGMALKRDVVKLLAFYIAESAYQLNIQCSGLGLGRAADDTHGLDSEVVLSVCLGLVMAVVNGALLVSRVSKLSTILAAIDLRRHDIVDELRARLHLYPDDIISQLNAWIFSSTAEPDQSEARDVLTRLAAGDENVRGRLSDDDDDDILEDLLSACAIYRQSAEEQRQLEGSCKRRKITFIVLLLLYLALIARACLQGYMTMFVCKTGMYNVGNGCVDH